MAEFRFYRENVYELDEQMQLTDEITSDNGLVVSSVPALCLYLPLQIWKLGFSFCKADS